MDFDDRGVGGCAWDAQRASLEVPPPEEYDRGPVLALARELENPRRRLPAWVQFNPNADIFVPGVEALRAVGLEMIALLLRKEIPVSLTTRGGLREAEALVTLARRFPGLLWVEVGLWPGERDTMEIWERGLRPNAARLELAAALREAGAEVAVRLGPFIPMVNDRPDPTARLLRAIARAGVRRVAVSWIEEGEGLLRQVQREVSRSAARMVDGWFRLPGASAGGGKRRIPPHLRERVFEDLAGKATALGIHPVACRCAVDHGEERCVHAPVGSAAADEQLDLFGQTG